LIPASFAQTRLWLLDQVEQGTSYHVPVTVRLDGCLDADALGAALRDVIGRHEPLRTRYRDVGGVPHQDVLAAGELDFTLPVIAVAPAELPDRVTALAAAPFDLAAGLPLRAALLRTAPDRHLLVLVIHHIACDGWSMGPLWRDLSAAYAARRTGTAPRFEPLPVEYGDYTRWQRELLGDRADPDSLVSRQLDYWRETLRDLPEELPLPFDRPRPDTASHRGGRVPVRIPAAVHAGLAELARSQGASLFMVLQAAVATLLFRLGSGTDVPIGSPVAGRTEEALDDLVGMFVNTLVLRTDLSGRPSFRAVLDQVRNSSLAALEHQDVPFEFLVEELAPVRSLSRNPLVQVMLALQNNRTAAPSLPGLTARQVPVGQPVAKFDLDLEFTESLGAQGEPQGIEGELHYATDLFEEATARSLTARLLRLLEAVAADPGLPVTDIDILAADERRLLLDTWQGPRLPRPAASLPELFAAQAARTPDAVAVSASGDELTYAELDRRAGRLARRLVAEGVRPGSRVVLHQERSVAAVVAILAVVKAGAVYVPLDTRYPLDRVNLVLRASDATVFLTDRDLAGVDVPDGTRVLSADEAAAASADAVNVPVPAVRVHPDELACVMFTSGSTGVPKGVTVTHRNITGLAADRCFTGAAHRRVLLHTSLCFDPKNYELWVPLLSGGTVVVAPPGLLDTAALARVLAEESVSGLWLTAGLFRLVADEDPGALAGLTAVWTGGDVVSPEAVRRVLEACPGTEVVNGYGPTETTTFATTQTVRRPLDGPAALPIGRPLDNTRLYVLAPDLGLLAPGLPGELYIAGAGLARGYLEQPALTAERFVADPYGPPGTRMYRTGDLVRWSREGELEYLGRADQQVKVRGFRIELGEIEAVLVAHASVAQATVILREDRPGDKRLVAYVVPDAEAADGIDTAVLRRHAAELLPDYMVPAAFVVLDTLPLTVNGKLDRRVLPAPPTAAHGTGRAPRDRREEALCELFAEVLGLPGVGVDDNFFDLGGHSLTAAQLTHHLRSRHRIDVPLRTVFEAPTVAALTRHLASAGTGPARPQLTAGPRPERPPLSSGQRRLWFMDQVEGPSPTYNMPVAFRLSGEPDLDALRSALDDVVARHEPLRTVFPDADGIPFQRVLAADRARPELVVDEVSPERLAEAVADAAHRCFDLRRDLPVRAHLLTTSRSEHVLLLVLHHIAVDGWSLRPLLDDLARAYTDRLAGRAPGWPPLPVRYTDYARWQEELLATGDEPDGLLAGQAAYWRAELAGLEPGLDLVPGAPRPAQPSYAGAGVPVAIGARLHGRLQRLARKHEASLFMVLQAAFAVVLSRTGGADEVAIGMPVAGRTDPALRDLVGMFVNTLVLRTDLSGDPAFADLLAQVKQKNLAAQDHQDLPFEQLVRLLGPDRSADRNPLFQVVLTLNNTRAARFELPDLSVTEFPFPARVARFDLGLNLVDRHVDGLGPAGVDGFLQYATDLYEEDTARALTDRFVRVLEAVADDPSVPVGAVDLLSPEERHTLLHTFNDTALPVAPATLPALFEAQVARTPGHTAVEDGPVRLTYRQLNARANRLARLLRAAGARPETTVALAVPRSADQIVGLLAIAKTGAAYLPVDTEYPAARIAAVLDDARPSCVVTTTEAAYRLPGGIRRLLVDHPDTRRRLDRQPATDLTDTRRTALLHPDHPAYVIYTSGSSGRPKGVTVTHRGIASLVRTQQRRLAVDDTSRVLQLASLSFDAAAGEILRALLSGAALVLYPGGTVDPQEVVRVIRDQRVTHAFIPPALLATLSPQDVPGLRTLTVGGEASPPALAAQWARGRRVLNGYGPTETTVVATHHRVRPEDAASGRPALPIGTPIANARVYVLDRLLRPLPAGSVGELYICGPGLARGYAHRPGPTAERFVACPYPAAPGERMYRTGDLARWNGRGELEFTGRVDGQVKIRGYRIETGEIESVLGRHPDVHHSVVTTVPDARNQPSLAAYVTAAPGAAPHPQRLRDHAARHLPRHMVPATVTVLDRIPLTRNGKTDRAALPVPDLAPHTARPPRTPLEHLLCEAFATVLNLPATGVDDNFFDLGGHSLTAAQLVHHLRTRHDIHITIRTLFEAPTVADLAEHLAARQEKAGSGGRSRIAQQAGRTEQPEERQEPQESEESELEVLIPLRTGGEGVPLFCVHPAGGLSWVYARLLRYLPADQVLYGLQARGIAREEDIPATVEDIARDYVRQIRAARPHGPYRLLGWSFGGVIAQAMAVLLQDEGQDVQLLALLDSYPTIAAEDLADDTTLMADMVRSIGLMLDPEEIAVISPQQILDHMKRMRHPLRNVRESSLLAMMEDYRTSQRSRLTHAPRVFRGDVLAFTATRSASSPRAMADAWAPYVDGRIEEHGVDCQHDEMMLPGHLDGIAAVLRGGLGG
jgi:amino acid adenylation domain-containing protein